MTGKVMKLEPQRRDAILNAALQEFAVKGFDKASTNIIAKEAGISKALLFHYINNKKDLFLHVYDYFTALLDKEYYMLMNYTEKDIFNRLRQSYLLQIKLMKQYPRIYEFNTLCNITKPDEIREILGNRNSTKHTACAQKLMEEIDISRFRKGLDLEKCIQLIFWSSLGFSNQIAEDSKNMEISYWEDGHIVTRLDEYFDELRKVFYRPSNE